MDEAGDRHAVRKSRNAMHKLSGVSSLMLITGKLMLMLMLMLITGKPSSPSSLSKFLPSYHPWSAHQ